jgi:hypothetical protein
MSTTITAAAITTARRHGSLPMSYVHADTGALFNIVAQTAIGPIAEGPRTGILARVVRTGQKTSASGPCTGQARVRPRHG